RLPTARTDPAAAPEPHLHDHPRGAEAHVDDRRSGQTQQPVECSGDAHVVLLRKSLAVKQPAACSEDGCASLSKCATCAKRLTGRNAYRRATNAAFQAADSPPNHEETPKLQTDGDDHTAQQ